MDRTLSTSHHGAIGIYWNFFVDHQTVEFVHYCRHSLDRSIINNEEISLSNLFDRKFYKNHERQSHRVWFIFISIASFVSLNIYWRKSFIWLRPELVKRAKHPLHPKSLVSVLKSSQWTPTMKRLLSNCSSSVSWVLLRSSYNTSLDCERHQRGIIKTPLWKMFFFVVAALTSRAHKWLSKTRWSKKKKLKLILIGIFLLLLHVGCLVVLAKLAIDWRCEAQMWPGYFIGDFARFMDDGLAWVGRRIEMEGKSLECQ